MKKTIILVLLILLTTIVFSNAQNEAQNYLLGNQNNTPLLLGEYNTNIYFVKQKPTDSYWFACFPTKLKPNYTHQCSICEACN